MSEIWTRFRLFATDASERVLSEIERLNGALGGAFSQESREQERRIRRPAKLGLGSGNVE